MMALLSVTLGLASPFLPPPAAAQHDNALGFKHFLKRETAAARALFEHALLAAPEYDAARYNLASTYAAEQKWAPALAQLDLLLLHNYPRYAQLVLADPDWAPIRVAEREKQELSEKLEHARAAYAEGLGHALIVVARTRPPLESAVGSSLRIFHHQEVYAYDLASRRWRQLTETAGRVVACLRAPDRRHVAVVTQEKARMVGGEVGRVMDDVTVRELDLSSLTLGTERALAAGTQAAVLGYAQGALRIATAPPGPPQATEQVVVRAGWVEYRPAAGPAPTPPPAVPLDAESLTWSPSGKRVLFRRSLPLCALAHQRGELFLYEPGRRRLTRVARASARFDPIWLDDDSFAFEDGLGERAHIRIWRHGSLTTLAIPHGTGLHAVPELPACAP